VEVTTRLKIEPRKIMNSAKHQIPHMPSWHTYRQIYLFYLLLPTSRKNDVYRFAMLSAVRYERGTWSATLRHGRPKYLRRRSTAIITGCFVDRTASDIHKRLNSGVMCIANSQFTIMTAGCKVKPDWPRIGEPCIKGNTQTEDERK